MHVLSVVFVTATLAIFGVMAATNECRIECPEGCDNTLVCNKYDNIEYTSTKCESDHLVECARAVEEKDVQVTEGACAKHTLDNCETRCDRAAPVCSKLNGKDTTFGSFCEFLTMANCFEADTSEHAGEIKLVGYGRCK